MKACAPSYTQSRISLTLGCSTSAARAEGAPMAMTSAAIKACSLLCICLSPSVGLQYESGDRRKRALLVREAGELEADRHAPGPEKRQRQRRHAERAERHVEHRVARRLETERRG